MVLAINLRGQAIDALREVWGDWFEEKAFESLIIQGYRERVFSVGRVAALVGLGTSFEAERWLADRGVEIGTLNTPPFI